MPVIGGTVAVNGDADTHAVVGEKLAKRLIEEDAVCVDPQVEAAHTVQRRPKFRRNTPQPGRTCESGLPAMEDDLHIAQLARCRVVCNTLRGLRNYLIRDGQGTATPALVSAFVDIAVVTC